MNTNLGYSKQTLTDSNVLLSGGGHKSLSDFIGTLHWDSTNRKFQYKCIGDTNYTDLITFGSLALDSTSYLPLSGGTMTGNINFTTSGIKFNGGTGGSRIFNIIETNNGNNLDIGWNWDNRDGATIALRNTDQTNEPGAFHITARNSNHSCQLVGKADAEVGTFKWCDKVILHSGNYTSYFVDEKVKAVTTNPASSTRYFLTWINGSGTFTTGINDGLVYYTFQGTTETVGLGRLHIGNATASGTAGNKQGYLRLYSQSAKYADFKTVNSLTDNRTYTFPDAGGTVVLNNATQALTNKTYNGYTLDAACAKGVTDNTSNTDVTSSDTNLITARTLYYQLANKDYLPKTGGTITTPNSTSTSVYASPLNMYCSNLGDSTEVTSNIVMRLGKSGSARNCVELTYNHLGNSSTSNQASLGFYGGSVITFNANKKVAIGTTINDNYALNVNGNINASGNITKNGTAVSLVGHTHDYLPLIGGNLSGDLFFTGGGTSGNRKFGIKKTVDNKNIDLGWDWSAKDGAGAFFRSADYENGCFGFYARNASGTTSQLIGNAGGDLKWGALNNEQIILHASNYTNYTYSSTASRTANTVLTAPNGSDGVATFRTLVAEDIPSLSYLPLTGGTLTGTVIINSGQDLELKAAQNSTDTGDIIFKDGSGTEIGRFWKQSGLDEFRVRFSETDTVKTLIHSGNIGSQSVASATSASMIPNSVKTGSCVLGGTHTGWINIARFDLSIYGNNDAQSFDLYVRRYYNSPYSESFTCNISIGWNTGVIRLLNRMANYPIVESVRIADSGNYRYIQLYVNPTYSTYENHTLFSIIGATGSWDSLNEVASGTYTDIANLSLGYGVRSDNSDTLNVTTVTDANSAIGDMLAKYYRFQAGASNAYPVVSNANGLMWFSTHGTFNGAYGHQLGFSSDGNMYHREVTNGTWSAWGAVLKSTNVKTINGQSIFGSGDITVGGGGGGSYLPLSGGTMTGAITFCNTTWNAVGDDCAMGDHDIAGGFAICGLNGNTRLDFCQYGNSSNYKSIIFDGSSLEVTANLKMAIGYGINAGNNGMLCYHPVDWTGVSSSQWGVGAIDSQGVIRSNNTDLVHYRGNDGYTIWDSSNLTPSNYLAKSGGTITGTLTVNSTLTCQSVEIGHTNEINATGSNNLYLQYRNTGNLVLCSNGYNCGIGLDGNTNPSYKLQVNGTTYSEGDFTCNGGDITINEPASGGAAAIWFKSEGTTKGNLRVKADGALYFYTGTSAEATGGNVYAGNFYTISDLRKKNVISGLQYKVEDYAKIPLINFEWKDAPGKAQLGTIAQNVQNIIPELVDGEDTLTVNYSVLGTLAGVEACKEIIKLRQEIQELKNKLYGKNFN